MVKKKSEPEPIGPIVKRQLKVIKKRMDKQRKRQRQAKQESPTQPENSNDTQ